MVDPGEGVEWCVFHTIVFIVYNPGPNPAAYLFGNGMNGGH
jgi:hypothetical protein